MNLLAHAILSDPDKHVLLGNLMADTIKGRACLDSLLPRVRAGVMQHRAVDHFTDTHPWCIAERRKLVSIRPLYRAVAFDILMDRLLARSWDQWTDEALETFAERVRLIVVELEPLHAPRFRTLAHRIITDGALLKGTTYEGLRFQLERIGEIWNDGTLLLPAVEDFARHEEELLAGFIAFFPELQREARWSGFRDR